MATRGARPNTSVVPPAITLGRSVRATLPGTFVPAAPAASAVKVWPPRAASPQPTRPVLPQPAWPVPPHPHVQPRSPVCSSPTLGPLTRSVRSLSPTNAVEMRRAHTPEPLGRTPTWASSSRERLPASAVAPPGTPAADPNFLRRSLGGGSRGMVDAGAAQADMGSSALAHDCGASMASSCVPYPSWELQGAGPFGRGGGMGMVAQDHELAPGKPWASPMRGSPMTTPPAPHPWPANLFNSAPFTPALATPISYHRQEVSAFTSPTGSPGLVGAAYPQSSPQSPSGCPTHPEWCFGAQPDLGACRHRAASSSCPSPPTSPPPPREGGGLADAYARTQDSSGLNPLASAPTMAANVSFSSYHNPSPLASMPTVAVDVDFLNMRQPAPVRGSAPIDASYPESFDYSEPSWLKAPFGVQHQVEN